jgi:hypothetical protein
MALPKLKTPVFELKLPSNGKAVKYRPFLVKEQKLLLMALESQESDEMFRAIKQIINNCSVDEVDVDDLPMFDLEYFFLRLRAKSIGETIELKLKHNDDKNPKGVECKHVTPLTLNLLEVEVQKEQEHTNKIILDEASKVGVVLKYPTVSLATKLQKLGAQNQIDSVVSVITESIDYIFDAENVYPASETSSEEISTFINDLSQDQFAKLAGFFNSMPKLKHTIKWKCSECGATDKVELEGMANFFG